MKFVIFKSGFDGMSGSYTCHTVDQVLAEIVNHQGWDTLKELHADIREWAEGPGGSGYFRTASSVILALPNDEPMADDNCRNPKCDRNGMEYGDWYSEEDGGVMCFVRCPSCGSTWRDVYRYSHHEDLEIPSDNP